MLRPDPFSAWWFCTALTVSGTAVTAFLNGVQDTDDVALASEISAAEVNVFIASKGNGSGACTTSWDGITGESLIFNRVLSASEIKAYYENTRHRYGV